MERAQENGTIGMDDRHFPFDWEGAVNFLRGDPAQQDLVRAAYYDDPAINAAERYRRSTEWATIQSLLPYGRSLDALDVGAGRGIASYALAKDGHRVTALEPDPSSVIGAKAISALACEAAIDIKVTDTLEQPLPYANGSFDVVFARAVLHHIDDLKQACAEFYRVLRPGGRLIAVREHVLSRREDLPFFLKNHPLHSLYGGENAYLLSDYTGAMVGAGFSIEHTLAPLASPINYGPASLLDVQNSVASRLVGNQFGLRSIFAKALGVPGVWPLVRTSLHAVDRRPGRLYSFVARRT